MLSNFLEIFKAHDPRMSRFAGFGKIFFHQLCDGSRVSYGIKHINKIFEEGHNEDYLQARIVSLMEGLQTRNSQMFAQYKYAEQEYPAHYRLLVEGLSDQTLKIISEIDVSAGVSDEPADLGQKFVAQLLKDREALKYQKIYKPLSLHM